MGRGKGRKRKPGARTASGALKRNNYPQPVYDRGADRVRVQRERFGEHYNSALGRAYAAGLLGDEAEAANRLRAGKRFSRLYSALIEQGRYRCALNPEPRSAGRSTAFHGASDRDLGQEWLFDAMRDLDKAALRPWLDQMLAAEFHDAGPVWLTRLLAGGRDPYDQAMLKHCIEALDCIAPALPKPRIRAA